MGNVTELQRKLSDFTMSLYREGFLNDQFQQLQQLQDESNPNFVVEVFHTFFKSTERRMSELAVTLIQLIEGFKKMDATIDQLMEGSFGVGGQRIESVCNAFRKCCKERNINGCLECLQKLESEYSQAKERIETMFELEKQILAAGGSLPPLDMP